MKNLWKVRFAAKYAGIGDLQTETVKVVANGSVSRRNSYRAQKRSWWPATACASR